MYKKLVLCIIKGRVGAFLGVVLHKLHSLSVFVKVYAVVHPVKQGSGVVLFNYNRLGGRENYPGACFGGINLHAALGNADSDNVRLIGISCGCGTAGRENGR